MRIFRFTINLRLWHPVLKSAEISAALGMTPKPRVATRRAVPDDFGGTAGATYTYWSSEGRSGEDSQLLQVLEAFIAELEPHAPFLSSFRASGGRVELFVGWFASRRSGGDVIGYDLLKQLGDLQIDLSFDVYSGHEEPDDDA
jgi:hypothetical protein